MAFALLIGGLVLVVAGVRGQQGTLFSLVVHDFTGPHNFSYWVVAILVLGFLGYVPQIKPVANAMIVLVVLSLVLANSQNGGFFSQFTTALSSTNTAAVAKAVTA